MHKTDWLYIRNVIEKDAKVIFVAEDIYHRIVIVRAAKEIFGIIRNRRPWITDQIKFIFNDDNIVIGFEKYKD